MGVKVLRGKVPGDMRFGSGSGYGYGYGYGDGYGWGQSLQETPATSRRTT